MKTVFADTFYFLALLGTREPRHVEAVAASLDTQLRIVTTECVLTEVGDACSDPRDRPDFVALYRSLVEHPRVKVIVSDTRLFQRGVDLFEKRPDKDWSVTDCISFVVMEEQGIREALTADKDFEQAGFVALLR